MCGDGVCDIDQGETCNNCFFDCGACSMRIVMNFVISINKIK